MQRINPIIAHHIICIMVAHQYSRAYAEQCIERHNARCDSAAETVYYRTMQQRFVDALKKQDNIFFGGNY